MDGVDTSVYRNSILAIVAAVSGFAAKKAEGMKFKTYQTSAQPVTATHGGRHTFASFAIEDRRRIAIPKLDLGNIRNPVMNPWSMLM